MTRPLSALVLLVGLCHCTISGNSTHRENAGGDDDLTGSGAGATGGSAGGSAGTDASGGGGEGGSAVPVTFDCALAPTTAQSSQVLTGARGYHGLAIDVNGLIYGADANGTLIRSTHDGDWMPFVSNLAPEQIAFAPNGDLHVTTLDSVLTVSPGAQVFTLNTDYAEFNYGLRMGPDGKAWVADGPSVRRIDTTTGAAEIVATINGTAHSLEFSRKNDRLYIGMISDYGGHLRVVDLDASFDAIGGSQVFAEISAAAWVDGVAVDACGNVYATNYETAQLLRVTPSGDVSVFVDWADLSEYGHDVIFGNGVGGFREDALYLPRSYGNNLVLEVVVGIPGRAFAGTVLNGPTD